MVNSILIDCNLLLRLQISFGITGSAFKFIKSYLSGRTECVHASQASSSLTYSKMGVPQDSVLRPIPFAFYILQIDNIASNFNISLQQFSTFLHSHCQHYSNQSLQLPALHCHTLRSVPPQRSMFYGKVSEFCAFLAKIIIQGYASDLHPVTSGHNDDTYLIIQAITSQSCAA